MAGLTLLPYERRILLLLAWGLSDRDIVARGELSKNKVDATLSKLRDHLKADAADGNKIIRSQLALEVLRQVANAQELAMLTKKAEVYRQRLEVVARQDEKAKRIFDYLAQPESFGLTKVDLAKTLGFPRSQTLQRKLAAISGPFGGRIRLQTCLYLLAEQPATKSS